MALSGFKKIITSANLVVLLGLAVLTCLPLTLPVKFPALFWVKQGNNYFLWASLFFLNLKVFVPKFIYRGRLGIFIFIVFIAQLFMIGMSILFDRLSGLPEQIVRSFGNQKVHADNTGNLIIVIITLVLFGISTIIAFTQKIRGDQLREQALEKEKISSELSFLKTQINPHFFFNVLHTIYGLIGYDAKTAQESVYSLSHMMRYVLYETQNNETTLQKEVAFLEDYIKLMQLRLTKEVQVIFDKPATFKDIKIAPMLFLPFIENAFKHGVSTIHPSYIYIAIKQSAESLDIEVKNSIFKEKADHLEESTGIGLENTKRRLNLIYPQRHTLNVEQDDRTNEFTVSLKLLLP